VRTTYLLLATFATGTLIIIAKKNANKCFNQ